MSKAFTRESDDFPDQPPPRRQATGLAPGAKNYMTPAGARRLREELNRLLEVERPAAAAPNDIEARQKLRVLDERILYLQHSLQSAEVVPRPAASENRVRFGATVIVRDRQGREEEYRIVGVDETDLDRGWVSWQSPLAKALLQARLGERVRLKFAPGDEELEIASISYE